MSVVGKDEITSVKILVIGNSGVGKTSLCHRYINEIFVRAYKPTVGGKAKPSSYKKFNSILFLLLFFFL
jgi:GTPase SAR1 family protein